MVLYQKLGWTRGVFVQGLPGNRLGAIFPREFRMVDKFRRRNSNLGAKPPLDAHEGMLGTYSEKGSV